ncbi:MAG TPA: GGDEF domain-containing protein [Pseudacidobacterium sp.]|nr:GGDEF domain-containing protein [Pseudacidobacterium sp.]
MHKRSPHMAILLRAAGAFLVLHMAAVLLAGKQAVAASYVFLIAAPLLATLACAWRGAACTGISRAKWMLVGAGTFLWFAGMVVSAHQHFQTGPESVALLEDFLYFIYGVPVLVALSVAAPDENFRPILFLDILQAFLAVVLAYFVLFNAFPFAESIAHPIPVRVLVRVHDIGNIVLVVAAVFPLLVRPQAEEKTFYRILAAYTLSYAIVAAIYNRASAYWNVKSGTPADLLIDLPWLLLAVPAFGLTVRCAEPSLQSRSNLVALFVNNASPIFFTFAVLALGVYITTKNLPLGIAVTCVALIVYCLRSTMLQSWYFSTQTALYEANNKLHALSLRDSLTGVANRGGFERAIKLECERTQRTGEPLALLMMDVDCFKALNDTYGHVHGDECLVRIATEIEKNLNRSSDTIARYGGEEFAVLLPKTELEGAVRVAEKLRNAVMELFIPNETEISNFVSISVGIAAYGRGDKISSSGLVHAADKALYVAKRNGRNRYEIAADSSLEHIS